MGRYVRQTKTGRLMIDRAKIREEVRLDGKYLITTSDDTLTPEDVALGYKNLLEAERGFRDLKGTIRLRPVFHRKEDRIRAHVLICFLALVIIRVCEIRAGETWRTIGDQLGPIKQGHFRSPDGEFTQRTELSAEQRQLLKTPRRARTPTVRADHAGRRAPPSRVGTRRTSAQTLRIPMPARDPRPLTCLPTSELGITRLGISSGI